MAGQLCIQGEIAAMCFDLLPDQRTELTAGQGFLLVDFGHHLLMRSHNFGTGNPSVVGTHHRSPLLVLLADIFPQNERALVLIRVLELSSRVDTNDTTLRALDLVDLVHGILIFGRDDLVGTIHRLTILTRLETPLDVFRRRLVQVMIDMSKGMLLDVCDTDVFVLVDFTTLEQVSTYAAASPQKIGEGGLR